MKAILSLLVFSSASIAFANSGGHEGHGLDAHQIKTIIYQSINVTIMFIGLIYFAKKPIQKMLTDKKEAYISAAAKAEGLKKKAEKELYEMKIRLSKLEATAEESVMRARAEAADMKNQIIGESLAISARIKAEAESAAKLEIEKAKRKIRDEMILMSSQLAKNQMSSGLTPGEQQNLKDSFIQNLGGV